MTNYEKLKQSLTDPDIIYELEERVAIRMESGYKREVAEEITWKEYMARKQK